MHGNVFEWCRDGYGKLSSGVTDPLGSFSWTSGLVTRGGSYACSAGSCTSSYRKSSQVTMQSTDIGFRPAMTLPNTADVGTLCAGESAPVPVDLDPDPKAFAVGGSIRYSSEWMTDAPAGAVAVVELNGAVLESAAGEGFIDWIPASNGIYTLTHKVMVNGEPTGETLTAALVVQGMTEGYTATQTTVVPVPYVWLWRHIPGIVNEYEAYELAAKSVAANGRKVWECYVLGLDPVGTRDFRIVSFPMKPDGTPDLGNITFDPPQEEWNVAATYRLMGAAALDGPWQEVPVSGDTAARFFKVEVLLP